MKLIVHTSESLWGNAAIIAKWHLARGWKNIGYHFVILNGKTGSGIFNKHFDGSIETGRPLDDDNMLSSKEFGAHVKGLNDRSIGVCLIGNSGVFTDSQIESLKVLVKMLNEQFDFLEVEQHSDYDKKKSFCAGLSTEFMKSLN